MRRCFIHIGTHKTGTTSVQMALNSHYSELRARHYLYPRAGRPPEGPHGHHNIAWEISADRRFQKRYGTIDDLIAEIRNVPDDIILSSEDFECSIHDPVRFQEFVRSLQSCRLDVKVIIYFRNQADYIQSLYVEMLKWGVDKPFQEFVEGILHEGRFCWHEWIFTFSYSDLLTRLQSLKDVDLIVRSYDKAKDGTLIGDYLSIFDLDPVDLGVDASIRANARADVVAGVKLFYQNRKRTPLDRLENRIIECLLGPLKDKSIDISDRSKVRIAERFHDSREHVLLRPEVAQFMGVKQPGRPEDALTMETVFSSHVEQQIENLTAMFCAEADGIRPE